MSDSSSSSESSSAPKQKIGSKVKDASDLKVREYSKDEVATHNTETDTWMIIHGKVYDVSSFLEHHPGGPEILIQHAGSDATNEFEEVFHSPQARQQLDDYFVGTLEGYTGDLDAVKKGNTPSASGKSAGASGGNSLIYIIPLLLFILAAFYQFVLAAEH